MKYEACKIIEAVQIHCFPLVLTIKITTELNHKIKMATASQSGTAYSCYTSIILKLTMYLVTLLGFIICHK